MKVLVIQHPLLEAEKTLASPSYFEHDRDNILYIIIILLAFTTHLRVLASSFLRFRDHTQGRTTVGRTPLDE
jgi:hypothetical protein